MCSKSRITCQNLTYIYLSLYLTAQVGSRVLLFGNVYVSPTSIELPEHICFSFGFMYEANRYTCIYRPVV